MTHVPSCRPNARRVPEGLGWGSRLWFLAGLVLLGCSPEPDPPSFSPIDGNVVTGSTTRYSSGDGLDPDLHWEGYPEGSSTPDRIELRDFRDTDGQLGIHALLIVQVAIGCPACSRLAQELPASMAASWREQGVRILELVIQGSTGAAATVEDALAWRQHSGGDWAVGADPDFTFGKEGVNYLPVYVLVDPRDLEIVTRLEGYQDDASFVDDLAWSNRP